MQNKLTTAQVLKEIKLNKSEYNIKTLNTIDTIDIIDTKNYEISSVFAYAEKPLLSSTSVGSLPEGVKEVIPPAGETVGLNVSAAPEITYLSASLKAPKTLRRTLNVDFRLSTTPPGTFNKLVFSLAHSSRQREFFDNIPEDHKHEWEYQEAYGTYSVIPSKDKWLGKGRMRDRFVKGQMIRSRIKFGLSAVLEFKNGEYIANVWIEGLHKSFTLSLVENSAYPYRYDSKNSLEKVEYIARGGWK